MLHSNRQQTWRPTYCMWEQPKLDKCKERKREWGSAGIQVTGVTHNQVIICLIMQHIDDTVGVYGSTDGHSTEVRMWQLSLCLSETQDCTVTSGFMIKPQHLRATCSDIFNTPELQPNHTSFNVQLAFMSHYTVTVITVTLCTVITLWSVTCLVTLTQWDTSDDTLYYMNKKQGRLEPLSCSVLHMESTI